jgi:hypothetical protein
VAIKEKPVTAVLHPEETSSKPFGPIVLNRIDAETFKGQVEAGPSNEAVNLILRMRALGYDQMTLAPKRKSAGA